MDPKNKKKYFFFFEEKNNLLKKIQKDFQRINIVTTAKTLGKGRRNPFVKTFWVKEFTGKGPHKFKIYEEN
tara:strand:- start:189 stop:401 length:213 start_codon:yes stop_codon:yes gene_type:complete